MSIDAAGDVGGVVPGKEPAATGKTQQQKWDDNIAIRVFAMLMSILGANTQMIFHSLMPQIAQEKIWQGAASGVYNIFTINPGTPPNYKDGQLTNKEADIFAQGWQFISWAFAHKGSKAWKDMPPAMKSWVTKMMGNPTITGAFNKLYQEIKKLQQLENQKPPNQKAITAQRNKVLGQVTTIQGFGTGKDVKLANEYKALRAETKTVQQMMSGLVTITYAMAMRVVYTITSLAKYITNMVKHLEQIKQKIDIAPLS